MDNNVKQDPFEMNFGGSKTKKTIAERVEDFFEDYGLTITTIGSYLCYAAIVIMTGAYLKKASKNGLAINVITPFPVRKK